MAGKLPHVTVREVAMLRYSVVLVPEEGGYVVYVPVLRTVTQGDTAEDALAMARDLIETVLGSMADAGEEIPVEDGPALFCVLDVEEPQRAAAPQQATGATQRV
jgi:predicted RNase H-like HicB family nuclease